MSGSIGDLLSSQNLSRLASAVGTVGQAQALANSRADGRTRLAGAGSLLTSIGSFLGSTLDENRQAAQYGFDVQRFHSTMANRGGFLDQSKFMVMIGVPRWCNSINNVTQAEQSADIDKRNYQSLVRNVFDSLPFLCKSVTVPGVSVTPTNIRHYGYGTYDVRPGQITYETLPLTFYIDNDLTVVNFFTKWVQQVINFDIGSIDTRSVNGAFYNEIQYKDNYVADIDIYIFDQAGGNFTTYRLVDAYPTSITGLDMSWNASNQLASLQVTFHYRAWRSNFITAASEGADTRGLSLFDYIIRGGTLAQFAAGFDTRVRSIQDVVRVVNNASTITRVFLGR